MTNYFHTPKYVLRQTWAMENENVVVGHNYCNEIPKRKNLYISCKQRRKIWKRPRCCVFVHVTWQTHAHNYIHATTLDRWVDIMLKRANYKMFLFFFLLFFLILVHNQSQSLYDVMWGHWSVVVVVNDERENFCGFIFFSVVFLCDRNFLIINFSSSSFNCEK